MNRLPPDEPDEYDDVAEAAAAARALCGGGSGIPEHLIEFLRLQFREAYGRDAHNEKELSAYMLLNYLLNTEAQEAMRQTAKRPPQERAEIEAYLDRIAREAVALGELRPVDQELHRNSDDVLKQARKLKEN